MISSNTALGAECRYIAMTVRGQQIQKAHAFVRTARKRLLYFERKQMKSIILKPWELEALKAGKLEVIVRPIRFKPDYSVGAVLAH